MWTEAIYLSDRIVIMTPQRTDIEIITVKSPSPDNAEVEFLELRRELLEKFG